MPYKLSATLAGHSADVRAVASPTPNLILSASRDATAIAWTKNSSDPSFRPAIFRPSTRYCNAVGYLPPVANEPHEDYIVIGSQDALITMFSLQNPKPEPDYTLAGHTGNVCSINISSDGTIISGSWDKTARVWKDFRSLYTLEGHEEAVWAVLILEPTKYLTGSADKTIRLWTESQTTHIYRGHNDVVRGLALLPELGFASCSNDSEIRVWTFGGDIVYTLVGHTSFAYSVAILPSGDIVSAGEDRSVRVWRDGECVQTIIHPAISVWCVSTMSNGDIVSGASDGFVRVFSESEERWASETELKEYEEKVASQALNKEQLGGLRSSDVKGPDALSQPGHKDGQVLLVQEGSSINAYQWSLSSGSWIKAGEVVDAVGSNRKQIYEGKEYDYVFDVDIQEGIPPLKLPYNASENPYIAAQRFLERNDLPGGYLDQVVKFIEKNTSGVTLGTSTEYVDPFTGASRYVSEENSSQTQPSEGAYADPFTGASRYTAATTEVPPPRPPPIPSTKIIPVPTPICFKQANVSAMRNKTYQLNDVLRMEISTSSLVISTQEMYAIDQAFDVLSVALGNSSFHPPSVITGSHVEIVIQILERWPVSQRFPILDLARLISAFAPSAYTEGGQCITFLNALFNAAEWSEPWSSNLAKSRETNALLTLRSIANVLQFRETGTPSPSILNCLHPVLEQLLRPPYENLNKSLRVVFATIIFNISCFFLKTEFPAETKDLYIQLVIKVISEEASDSETIYRVLVALGNYLYGLRQRSPSSRLQESQQQVLRVLVEALVEKKATEERIYSVGADIAKLL